MNAVKVHFFKKIFSERSAVDALFLCSYPPVRSPFSLQSIGLAAFIRYIQFILCPLFHLTMLAISEHLPQVTPLHRFRLFDAQPCLFAEYGIIELNELRAAL